MALRKHSASQPINRYCQWYWRTYSSFINGTAMISDSDGLPVELMDFSIESED